MDSFIKIYRKLLDWEWYTDGNTMRLFVHLLIKANYKDKQWKGIDIKRGQVLTGRISLAKELNISERSIRTSLNHLKSTNEITIKSTNKYSVITICNYDCYQDYKKKSPSKSPNKKPTIDQQPTTTKESKESKEEDIPKHKLIEWLTNECPRLMKMKEPLTNEQAIKLLETYKEKSVKDIFLSMSNWKGLTKNISAYLTCIKWLKKEHDCRLIADPETKDLAYYDSIQIEKGFLTREQLEERKKLLAIKNINQ